MNEEFKSGEIVEHKLSREWVMILSKEKEFYKCRTKSFEIILFSDFELEKRILPNKK